MAVTISGSTGIDKVVDGSIATVDLADDAVTLAKLSATGSPSSSNFLRGDNSWAAVGGGLSNVAMFYKNAIVEYTGLNQTITGWTAYNNVGTAPTESSGVFTFPSTGYWLVRLQANLLDDTDTSGSGLVKASIFQGTTEISNGAAHINEAPYNHQVTLVPQVLLNITDVAAAAQKITFKVSSHSGSTVVGLKGGSNTPYSNILFQKIN
jgi:hypothetical protein